MNSQRGLFWLKGHNLNKLGKDLLDYATISSFKALGLVVPDKKIFILFFCKPI